MRPDPRIEARLDTEAPNRNVRIVEYQNDRLDIVKDRGSAVEVYITMTVAEAEHLVVNAKEIRNRVGVFVLNRSPETSETYLVARNDQHYRFVNDETEITLTETVFNSLVSTLLQWEYHPVGPLPMTNGETEGLK